MATRDAVVSGGAYAAVMPFASFSRATAVAAGVTVTFARPSNAGSRGPKRVSDWLPRIDEAAIDLKTGRLTVRWYNYLREIGLRLGGINGDSVEEILARLSASDADQSAAINYMMQVAAFAKAVQQQTVALTAAVSASGTDTSSVPPPAAPPPTNPLPSTT